MKNTLLTTTAIALTSFAGAANAVEVTTGAVTMQITGYFDVVVGASNQGGTSVGTADYDGLDVLTTSEVHFKPSITLDNGITIGADIELEGDTSGDQIDESTIFAKGDFGLIEIGSKDSAAKRLGIIAPDASLIYANSTSSAAFLAFSGVSSDFSDDITTYSTYADLASDAERITYLTPNFNGFQAGFSYARDAAGDSAGFIDSNTDTTDYIDLGASYNGTLGGVDLGISARYSVADRPDVTAVGPTGTDGLTGLPTGAIAGVTAVAAGDISTIGFGISLGFGDFTIGGSYLEQDADLAGVSDGEAYDIGVSYANGPATYSLTYFSGESLGVVGSPADFEFTQVVLAARYAVSSNFLVAVSISDTTADVLGVEEFDAQLLAVGASFSF